MSDPQDVFKPDEGQEPKILTIPVEKAVSSKGQCAGMGIVTNKKDWKLSTALMMGNGDRARMNEPSNKFGVMFLQRVMLKVRERWQDGNSNQAGEKTCVDAVLKDIFPEVAEQTGTPMDVNTLTDNHGKAMFALMKGFNENKPGNKVIEEVMIDYFRIRAGHEPSEGNEYLHLVATMESFYVKHANNVKSMPGRDWCNLVAHLLNAHINEFTDCPPIAMAKTEADKTAVVRARARNTKTVWIRDPKKRNDAIVEIMSELRRDQANQGLSEDELRERAIIQEAQENNFDNSERLEVTMEAREDELAKIKAFLATKPNPKNLIDPRFVDPPEDEAIEEEEGNNQPPAQAGMPAESGQEDETDDGGEPRAKRRRRSGQK